MEAVPSPSPIASQASEADRTRGRLDQLERLRGCLQKALGHELPNQLVAVQGLVKLLELEEGDRLTADGREYLTRLGAAARRAHELIAVLAEVCRAAREPGREGAVPLAEAVSETAAEVKRMFPGLPIEYHLPNPSAVLAVPRTPLRQVLLQLLKNAAQAAEGRPLRVELTARPTPVGPELVVIDDGRGMTPEHLQRLFVPFEAGIGGGAGLGLFLVRQLAESWGGGVRVESEPGRGTTVTLALPADGIVANKE